MKDGRYRIKVGRQCERPRKRNAYKGSCRAKDGNKQLKSNFERGELDEHRRKSNV